MKKATQQMRRTKRKVVSHYIGKLFYFFIIVGFHLHAQSFSGDEIGIYIEKGTSVYVKDGVTVSGLKDGYITKISVKAVPDSESLSLEQDKTKKKYAELKKAVEKVQKHIDAVTSKTITLPSSENRYRLGLVSSNGSLAIVTGNPSVKHIAVYERFGFEKYIIFREEGRVSYATILSPVSGILTIHFSRPPPFNGIV